MTKPQVKIVDVTTGEEIVRDATADEIAQMQLDAANAQARKEAEQGEIAKKATAEAKLAALGLTADDLKALGLGGK
jgi:molybdenum cofactor biosynthesis enzyme